MVLLDDRKNRLMGGLDRMTANREPFYDFPLMMNSGRLKGWLLKEESIFDMVADVLLSLKEEAFVECYTPWGTAIIRLPQPKLTGIR